MAQSTVKVCLSWFEFYETAALDCPRCGPGAIAVRARELLMAAVFHAYPEIPDITLELDASDRMHIRLVFSGSEQRTQFSTRYSDEIDN